MSSILKPRNYYKLKYSAIPDSKIQQVVGTYVSLDYTGSSTHVDETSRKNYSIELKDGTIEDGTMPLITNINNQSYYQDKYNENVTYTNSGGAYPITHRTEGVAADFQLIIDDDVPIRFNTTGEDVDDVTLTDVSGKIYIREGTNQTGTDMFWTYFDDDNTKLYGTYNINVPGGGTRSTEDMDELLDINLVRNIEVDSVYDGHVQFNNKYRLILHVYVYLHYAVLDTVNGFMGADASIYVYHLHEFKLQGTYHALESKEIEFEQHAQVANYEDYPFRIQGNEYTSSLTEYNFRNQVIMPWSEWAATQILDRYTDGKYFVSAEIKLSYLVENNIDIDSEIVIKDTNNKYIERGEGGNTLRCIFKVKNIEYNCDKSSYSANVILLEDHTIPVYDYVIDSNNIRVITSNNNIKIIIRRE